MDKRRDDMAPAEVQQGNRGWWTRNTMSYDWADPAGVRFTPPWFDEIDRRFVHAARLFATDRQPFDRIIPFADLRGKRVLEIGCGMGLHTELMTRAGATVTAVDLSETSIEATRARLELKGVQAQVQCADAENLPFQPGQFDFVWSWGVIHHSARTGRIVREIARVLQPEGSCRIMVYHRHGAGTQMKLVREHVLKGGFLRQSLEETLDRTTDGFRARFYVPDQFEDLFRTFFTDVTSIVCGQDSDALPVPRGLRNLLLRFVSDDTLRQRQAKKGSFVFLTASRPF